MVMKKSGNTQYVKKSLAMDINKMPSSHTYSTGQQILKPSTVYKQTYSTHQQIDKPSTNIQLASINHKDIFTNTRHINKFIGTLTTYITKSLGHLNTYNNSLNYLYTYSTHRQIMKSSLHLQHTFGTSFIFAQIALKGDCCNILLFKYHQFLTILCGKSVFFFFGRFIVL
jgi:hypothetical protein